MTAIGTTLIVVTLPNGLSLYALNAHDVKVNDEVDIEVTQDNFWWNDLDTEIPPPTFVADLLI